MATRRLSAASVLLPMFMAACSTDPVFHQESKRSGDKDAPDEQDPQTPRTESNVTMTFILPADVERPHKVEGEGAQAASHTKPAQSKKKAKTSKKDDSVASSIGVANCQESPDSCSSSETIGVADAVGPCYAESKPLVIDAESTSDEANEGCVEASDGSLTCWSSESADKDSTSAIGCELPPSASVCEDDVVGSIPCATDFKPSDDGECVTYPDGSGYCSGSAGYPSDAIDFEPGISSASSRIRVSCLATAEPFVLDSVAAIGVGPYFDFLGALWAAPTLRIGLEEQGPMFGSFESQAVPFLCQGAVAIEIVDLDPGAVYTVSADLFGFDLTHLYSGSTDSFTLAKGGVTAVKLNMHRVESPEVDVVVDLVFDDEAGASTENDLPGPKSADE